MADLCLVPQVYNAERSVTDETIGFYNVCMSIRQVWGQHDKFSDHLKNQRCSQQLGGLQNSSPIPATGLP